MRTPLVQGSTSVMTDNLNKNHICHIQHTFTKLIKTIRRKDTEPPRVFFFLIFGLKEAFTLHLNPREGQILHGELTGLQNHIVSFSLTRDSLLSVRLHQFLSSLLSSPGQNSVIKDCQND